MIPLFIGAGIGYLLGQLAMLFFQEEIFDWMDRAIDRVRGWFGLRPSSF